MIDGLIETARTLAGVRHTRPERPRQSDLRRAVSTAYYAVFHALAQQNADLLVGSTGAVRSERAWVQAYRAIDHKGARTACKDARSLGFPAGIVTFAETFIALQKRREDADYDPTSRLTKAEALAAIEEAQTAIEALKTVPTRDRRAFSVQILLKRRN